MKTNKFWSYFMMLVLVLSTTVSLSSCGPDDDDDMVSVSMSSVNFSADGGSQSIMITSNTKWTVSGNPSWLIVSPIQGSNNGAISLVAEKNPENNSRNGILYISAGNASATISVNQSGFVPDTRVTITNGSTYTLNRFRVVFVNSKMEQLTDRDFGTLDPGTTIVADIPTSATEYYMATYLNSKWFFSPNYDVTFTKLNLTNAEVGNWAANASPKISLKATSEKAGKGVKKCEL